MKMIGGSNRKIQKSNSGQKKGMARKASSKQFRGNNNN